MPPAGTPPHAATSLSARLFGLNDPGLAAGGAPKTTVGTLRLWDTGTTWRDIQPGSATQWKWEALDAAVRAALAAHAQPLLVLGQTPAWAATNPALSSAVGPGAASPPKDSAAWTAYVKAVAERYKGRIGAYEVWDEANLGAFWSGTPAQLVSLAKTAKEAIRSVDPSATVTTPSFVVQTASQREQLASYLAAGGAAAADVINVQASPSGGAAPESLRALFARVLGTPHVTKPVWDTALGYGAPAAGSGGTQRLSETTAAAYVARTYLVGANLWGTPTGMSRIYWYAWNRTGSSLPIRMTDSAGKPTAAGQAYARVQQWIGASGWRGCRTGSDGTWTCWVRGGRVVWNPTKTVTYAVPAGLARRTTLAGTRARITPGSTFALAGSPVLLTAS